MSFFSQFPTIVYANTVVTDITRRITIPDSILRQPTAFSPYTVQSGQRADLVSYLYYGQDDDDWIIMLANQIVDPHYGWYMNDDELARHVIKKYGSLPAAMGRISHWLSNWSEDPRQISTAYYDDLTENLKKYWIPVFGDGASVIGYARRQEDWTVATNRLVDITMSSPVSFSEGELVTVYDPSGEREGTGELVWVSGARVTIKDQRGTWETGYSMVTETGSETISSMSEPTQLIPIDEEVYFTPVTFYDVEYDLNESNKEVLLIQDGYRGVMYQELARKLAS